MKKIFKIACIFSLLFPLSLAAQGTYTAASCNTADVNAVINGPTHTAVNGDIIVIPAGSCSWSSGITISGVGISIIGTGTPNTGPSTRGAGTSSTVIASTIPNGASALFNISGLTNGQLIRISLINFTSQTNTNPSTGVGAIVISGSCTTSGCANLRLDNLNFGPTWNGATLPAGSIVFSYNMFGVVDHNSINGPDGQAPYFINANLGSYQGVGLYGDNSWAQPDTLGTAQAMYIENNIFNSGTASEGDFGFQSAGGGRYVCRYNTFSDVATEAISCGSHGTSSGGRPRGMRHMEAYGNTLTCTSSAGCEGPLSFNSGTGYIFNNTWNSTGSGFFNGYASINAQRSAGTGWPAPWGDCDGTGLYDLNSGGSAVTCIDQPGRGQGTYLSGYNATPPPQEPTPVGWPSEVLDPIGEWGDTVTGGFTSPMFTGSSTLAANRDFYYEGTNQTAQTSSTAPFNGSSGVGHGPRSLRPSTCTTGVMYWSTDQGTWNQSGSGGQGVLDKCTGTNTWSNAAYTPYTYPHPLTTGSPQAATPSFSPSSGAPPQTVTLSTTTSGASICYTVDGSTPTAPTAGTCSGGTTSTYSSPISVTVNPTTINALSTKTGYVNSNVGSSTYSTPVLTCGNPSQNSPYSGSGPAPGGGYYYPPALTISFTSPTTGCNMVMTLDGTAPNTSCTIGGSTVAYSAQTITSTTTMRVVACQSGYTSSQIEGGTWTLVPASSGIYLDSHSVFNGGATGYSSVSTTISPTVSGEGVTCEFVFSGTTLLSAISDNVNGVYTVAIPAHLNTNVTSYIGMYYKSNVAAGPTTITLNLAGTGIYVALACQSWANFSGGLFTLDAPFVQQQDATTQTTTPTTGTTLTPSFSNELVMGNLLTNNVTSPTAGTNFTITDGAPGPDLFPSYWVQSTATSTNAPYTLPTADWWTDQMAAFYFAGIVPPTATNLKMSGLTAKSITVQ